MNRIRISIICFVLAAAPSQSASVQARASNSSSDPLSAEKVPNTTVVGQNKPPSRDASPTSVVSIERLTPRRAADDAISREVCRGCASEPSEISSLTVPAPVVASPEKRDVQLDELQSVPQPKQHSDLDTVALASAQREQAKSMEEKTNGLWQSWVVSVCKGCGDQEPAKALRLEDWPLRDAPTTTGSIEHNPRREKVQANEAKRVAVQHHGSLEADLSPENVDSIRRMPKR